MLNIINFFNSNSGVVTLRQLVVAHGGKRAGGKNYRLVRKLIDRGVIFQVGDNLYLKG